MEGEHADEMRAPDAEAHDGSAAGEPSEASGSRSGAHASREVERSEAGEHRYDDRQDYEDGIIAGCHHGYLMTKIRPRRSPAAALTDANTAVRSLADG